MSDYTNRINELLKSQNKKRVDLCRACNIPESTVRTWIKKGATPSAEAALKVAQFFGVSIEYLIAGVDGSAPEFILSDEEKALIMNYRSSNQKLKDTISLVADVCAQASR